jgi:hypothetical protein
MKTLLQRALRPLGYLAYWSVLGLRLTVRLCLALLLMTAANRRVKDWCLQGLFGCRLLAIY